MRLARKVPTRGAHAVNPIGPGPVAGIEEVGQAFRENGPTAAITALVGGTLALAATVTRKAFTNAAMLERPAKELHLERERIDKQRAEDRKADADRLERIETDFRAMRKVMFEAFQRGPTD